MTVTALYWFAGANGKEEDEDTGIGLEAMKLSVRIYWGETQGMVPYKNAIYG